MLQSYDDPDPTLDWVLKSALDKLSGNNITLETGNKKGPEFD